MPIKTETPPLPVILYVPSVATIQQRLMGITRIDNPHQVFHFTRWRMPHVPGSNHDAYYTYTCDVCQFSVSVEWLRRDGGNRLLNHDCEFRCNHLTCVDMGNPAIWISAFKTIARTCTICHAPREMTYMYGREDETINLALRPGTEERLGSCDGV